jgi:hypothetical protein
MFRFSRSHPAPSDALTLNGALWRKSYSERVPPLQLRSTAALAFVNAFAAFQYIFALEPVFRNNELDYIAGSTCDDTRFCSIAKLAAGSYGYTSIVCARMTANPKAIVGDNLPAAKLVGTRWEGDDTTYCIVSMPSVFIVSMQGTIVTGQINDPEVAERWSDLSQDHAEYLTHIDAARRERSDINKVFVLIEGDEAMYVSPDYDARHWDARAPSVTIQTCTPEDIPDVFASVRSTLGCDRHSAPPAAAATFTPPSGVPPTVTILREVDVNADAELNDLTAVFTTMFMAGDIDYERGEITELRAPTWSDPFLEVLSSKKAEARARGLKVALHSVIHAEEENNYAMAGKLDAQRTYLSLHCIPDSLIKLIVNCKFNIALVDDIRVTSPTVDVYSFMPQIGNSEEVSKAMRQGDYEDNEAIMGQVEIHLMKKKLSAMKLGKLDCYDDVIRNVINIAAMNLAVENLTGSVGNQSICYQLLMQFASLFLRPSWKK